VLQPRLSLGGNDEAQEDRPQAWTHLRELMLAAAVGSSDSGRLVSSGAICIDPFE
jgi:hypothetical protein